MVSRVSFAAISILLFACGEGTSDGRCAEQAAAGLERGRALLDESRDGEHYRVDGFDAAMAELRGAAEQGSRDAQSLYGRTLFGSLFSHSGPAPSERAAYVSALVALRRAGRAGDEEARAFLPGWSAASPSTSSPPLDALPSAWLDEAIAEAEMPVRCPASRL